MESREEKEMATNDQYSLGTPPNSEPAETNKEDILIFEDLKPYKLFISDIIY
ncbi:MAG: hypothetical protein ABR968_08900 [Bacteroidales bacterium]|jgi:hypothetical protein